MEGTDMELEWAEFAIEAVLYLLAVLIGGAITRFYARQGTVETHLMLQRVAHAFEQLFAMLFPEGAKVVFGRDADGNIDFDQPVNVIVEPGTGTVELEPEG
jgi:hypothetical protein